VIILQDLLLDIITYLKNLAIVSGDGIDAFRDGSPVNPDDCLYILEYKGKSFQLSDFGVRWVQFNYRSTKYSVARSKCMQVFKCFGVGDEDVKIQLTPNRWAVIHCTNSPFKSTVDGQGRVVFTFNARVFTAFE
jgi:hypothetical protein